MKTKNNKTNSHLITYSSQLATFMFQLSVIVCLCFAFSSCRIFKHQEKSFTEISKQQQEEFNSNFFNATKERLLGNNENAVKFYNQCLKIDNNNAEVLYELASLFFKNRQFKEALFYSKKSVENDDKNIWYKLLLSDVYSKTGKYQDAADLYEKITDTQPNNINFYFDWINNLTFAGKYNDAIKVCDKVQDKFGMMEELSFQKEKLYIQMKKLDMAMKEIEALIQKYPKETKYYGMLAELYLMDNKKTEAFELYKKILEIEPDNGMIHVSLANYYQSTGEKEKAFEEIKLAFTNTNLNIDDKVKILLDYYTFSEKDTSFKNQAFKLLRILVEVHPDEAKAHSIYGDFLYRDKKTEESKKEFLKVVSLDSSKYVVWEQLIIIDNELKDYTSLEKTCMTTIELFPNQPVPYIYCGMARVLLKKYDTAIEILKKGKVYAGTNKPLLAEFLSMLGEAYNEIKDYASSDESYEKCIEIDSKNATALNNYSYFLVLRNKDLEKAEEMAKKANNLSPDNSAYEDTYGWVLYKRQNYSEAKKWIEKAMNHDGNNDSVILEHYGDILYKLGEIEKSLEYWNKAKSKGKGSDLLDKKIQEKKLIEE
ncbi:MAG: tetratricopeptide repeat protein [Bacteroidales bacterium]|nr:tetratricopeptide repeat protein [Bacteroidales bacterium]